MTSMNILSGQLLRSMPLEMLVEHEKRAILNHGQSLKQLRERGGLAPVEALAILQNKGWDKLDPKTAEQELFYLVKEYENSLKED